MAQKLIPEAQAHEAAAHAIHDSKRRFEVQNKKTGILDFSNEARFALEAIQGDVLIPTQVDVPMNFFPKAPLSTIDGQIISVVGGVTQIGQYQVVVLNRGTNDGLAVGDVLTVFQAGETIKDRFGGGKVKLPDEEAGTIMVFKTFDRISYGLVMEATTAIHVLDAVRNPS